MKINLPFVFPFGRIHTHAQRTLPLCHSFHSRWYTRSLFTVCVCGATSTTMVYHSDAVRMLVLFCFGIELFIVLPGTRYNFRLVGTRSYCQRNERNVKWNQNTQNPLAPRDGDEYIPNRENPFLILLLRRVGKWDFKNTRPLLMRIFAVNNWTRIASAQIFGFGRSMHFHPNSRSSAARFLFAAVDSAHRPFHTCKIAQFAHGLNSRRFFSLSFSMFFLFRNDLYATIFVSLLSALFFLCSVSRCCFRCSFVLGESKRQKIWKQKRRSGEKSANTLAQKRRRIRPFLPANVYVERGER